MIDLQVFHESNIIKSIPLQNGEWSIGSSPYNNIQLDYPTVSKRHAILNIDQSNFYITDTESKNGIYLLSNDNKIRIESKSKIKFNEVFYIGPFGCKITQNKSMQKEELLNNYLEKYNFFCQINKDTALEQMSNFYANDIHFSKEIYNTIKNEFEGDGPITEYLKMSECKEIIINNYNEIYIDVGAGLKLSNLKFISYSTFESWVYRIVQKTGKRLDLQSPICESSLENGARFHAVIPPISQKSINVSIRKYGSAPISIESALKSNWITIEKLKFIQHLVENKFNCIISGGTSAGKTSLLNFMCQFFHPEERIITIEDTIELSPKHKNTVQLLSRKTNSDGIGEISIRKLIQTSLRMRPDRIIVGECRGEEVIEMLQALNTGHPGSLTTIHANSTHEAVHRLELLCLLGTSNVTIEALRAWIYNSVDAFIHVTKDSTGNRSISQISITSNAFEKLNMKNDFIFQNKSGLYDFNS